MRLAILEPLLLLAFTQDTTQINRDFKAKHPLATFTIPPCKTWREQREALNKRLKYRFLYRHHLTDEGHARKTVAQAVEDYHQQPLKVLHGLTAIEVLTGSMPNKKEFSIQIGQVMAKRPLLNAQNACLDCTK